MLVLGFFDANSKHIHQRSQRMIFIFANFIGDPIEQFDEFPVIASQELTTSSSRFFISFVIDDLPRRFNFTPEIRIADATLGQEINLAAEKLLDGNREIEVAIGVGAGRLIREANNEIDVALRGIEIAPCRRAEHFKSPHSKASALFSQTVAMHLNDRIHMAASS